MNLPLQILVKNIFFHAKVMPINIQAVLEPLGIYRDGGKRPSRMSLIPWIHALCGMRLALTLCKMPLLMFRSSRRS